MEVTNWGFDGGGRRKGRRCRQRKVWLGGETKRLRRVKEKEAENGG